jgi:arginase family enzyme
MTLNFYEKGSDSTFSVTLKGLLVGTCPIVIGVCASDYPGGDFSKPLGVLNFDAHTDSVRLMEDGTATAGSSTLSQFHEKKYAVVGGLHRKL